MLIRGVLLCLGGFLLLRMGLAGARRGALLDATFWRTFRQYASYRIRRIWPVVPGLAGLILFIWGLILLFQWILAYYADRLGHPLSA